MTEKEYLQQLVNESDSFSDILRKQGKSVSGAAVKILHDKLDAYEIDCHLLYTNKPHKSGELVPLEKILVENSNFNKKILKERLIKYGIKKNCCEKCGCNGEWMGEPIVMQLHHINGISNDNRLENLIMLCPNCHSQTENYAGGNRKKPENHCKDCGKVIGRRSTYCLKCAAKRNNKPKVENKPLKEELLSLIMTLSFRKIGEMYGVTDKAIVKWCKKYGLPSTRKEIKKYIMLGSYNG